MEKLHILNFRLAIKNGRNRKTFKEKTKWLRLTLIAQYLIFKSWVYLSFIFPIYQYIDEVTQGIKLGMDDDV